MANEPTQSLIVARVWTLRLVTIAVLLGAWEILGHSGLFYRDVMPSVLDIGYALLKLLSDSDFYFHLGVTMEEIAASVLIGGITGLVAGLVLGSSRFLWRAFEPYLYYLGSAPKLMFFPVMILLFGVGSGSKIALGAISCFFPVALSAVAGLRQIDPVLVRVGRSFRLAPLRMATKIYLPALRQPIVNGLRLGLGIALIAVLLAETKLSNRGVGHLIIQAFAVFDMPQMYALLISVFALAIAANAFLTRVSRAQR